MGGWRVGGEVEGKKRCCLVILVKIDTFLSYFNKRSVNSFYNVREENDAIGTRTAVLFSCNWTQETSSSSSSPMRTSLRK